MAFHVTHVFGQTDSNPPFDSFEALLKELQTEADAEHFSVGVTHESEWCLEVSPNGLVTWENLEAGTTEPRHMKNVPDEKVIWLWRKLAVGEIKTVNLEPWLQGYY